MGDCIKINTQKLYEAVFEGCFRANLNLSKDVYKKILESGDKPRKLEMIRQNAALANLTQRPLCQDTGQVIVFVGIGQNVCLEGENLNSVINRAVSDCYTKNFFRKSILKNALTDRTNTKTNAPAVIYTEITERDEVRIDILIKGAGAENMSKCAMLNPLSTKEEIFNFVLDTVQTAKDNACPPMFLGIGIGATLDWAAVLSKKAFFGSENPEFCEELKEFLNKNCKAKTAEVNLLTAQTHIASLPVCVTINCHSTRHAGYEIDKTGKITCLTEFETPTHVEETRKKQPEIRTDEIDKLKALIIGNEILLSGEIYTARDMAHKKMLEMLDRGEELPFDIKDKIIFYAGPCPKNENEVVGPIGPTTAKRMDNFTPKLYEAGLFATIGKGKRSIKAEKAIRLNNGIYFTTQGGVACLLQSCVKEAQVVAFEELGTEAVYRLVVEKLPVKVSIK